jgi:hypothetical protein
VINILSKRKGSFVFLLNNYEVKEYNDFNDIPDPSEIMEVISFLPEIPPPPHTVQQHEEIHLWQLTFKKLLEEVYASRR